MVKSNGNSHINKWLYLGKQYSYPCTTEDFVCSHPSHPEMRGARQNRNITCTCSCVLPASSLHLCLASLASPCILSCIAMHTLLHRHAYSPSSLARKLHMHIHARLVASMWCFAQVTLYSAPWPCKHAPCTAMTVTVIHRAIALCVSYTCSFCCC